MKYIWVVRFITRKQWDEYYSHNPVYSPVEKVRGGYRVGFLILEEEVVEGKFPIDCAEANEFDIVEIGKWRERHNIFPR